MTWIFAGLTGCTEDRDDSLHNRADQWAAPKGRLRKSSPDRPFVQPAGPALCLMCSPRNFTFSFGNTALQPARRDDWIVDFHYPILYCFWKMISVSDPNPVWLKLCYPYPKTIRKCIAMHNIHFCAVYILPHEAK